MLRLGVETRHKRDDVYVTHMLPMHQFLINMNTYDLTRHGSYSDL